MRPLLSAAVVALALVASCKQQQGSPKLEGHWKGQRAEGVTTEVRINANVFATSSEIVARGNQISFSTPAARNVTATYFVDKEDATTVVIHTDKDMSTETFTFGPEPKTMTWKVDDRRSIVFRKVD